MSSTHVDGSLPSSSDISAASATSGSSANNSAANHSAASTLARSATAPPTTEFPPRRATTYQPLVLLLAAFATGIVTDSYASPPLWVWFAGTTTAAGLWFAISRLGGPVSGTMSGPVGGTLVVLVAVAGLGGTWHHVRWRLFRHDELARQLDETNRPVCVDVTALGAPKYSPAPARHPLASYPPRDETEVLVEVQRVRNGREWRTATGHARLRVTGSLDGIHCGDRFRVMALAARPRRAKNPGEFDVAAAERTERRLTQLFANSPAAISLLQRGSGWSWRRWIADVRQAGQRQLGRHVHERHSGLAAAILLGTREQLAEDLHQGFFRTGLAHLLAISGLNVAIFAYGFWAFARLGWLPRRAALAVAAALAIGYALLTDAQAPVVRAAIVVVCICVARAIGRPGLAYNMLAAAGLIVLGLSPATLFQTGAQLSFLAVAVLCHVPRPHDEPPAKPDPLDKLIARSRPWWQRFLRRVAAAGLDAFLTSGRVWLVSLPLVVARFHLVSAIGLVLNPLVMLPTAVALYAGFLTLIFGPIAPPLASACGQICGGALAVVEWLIQWGLSVPGNHFWMAAPPMWWTIAFYVGATVGATIKLPRRWTFAFTLAWFACGLACVERRCTDWQCMEWRHLDWRDPQNAPPLSFTFVAVGHGTCVAVELPDGRTLLYDCGRLGWPPQAARLAAGVLWSRGITRIDAAIVSHADADHYNGLPDLHERISIAAVYLTPRTSRNHGAGCRALRRLLRDAEIPLLPLIAPMRLTDDHGASIEVLHPTTDDQAGSDNSQSIVLAIEYAGRRILLPGDIEAPGLTRLLARPPGGRYDVVMAPHHGSQHSSPQQFAAWSDPSWVVISGSLPTTFDAATAAFESHGARVFHTARDGAVHVRIDTQGVQVRTWREGAWR